jgi:hypothetical protein
MVGRLRQDEFRVNTDEGGGQLHVERFTQTKVEGGLSAKTIRNLLLVLQAILSLAVDNDLIARSPIRTTSCSNVDASARGIRVYDLAFLQNDATTMAQQIL